jgi:hypothetical protein
MSRPSDVHMKEYKYNLTQDQLEKSKLVHHAYREGHKICWKETKVLQIEPNTIYRKYKESAHMSLIDRLISQPSLDNSPIWTPVITAEVKQKNNSSSSVQCKLSGEICVSYVGDDFYSDITLVLCLICVEFFNVLT